jgi:hypothetical protein
MRGGKITTAFRAGSVTINFRVGHVDTMPRCAVCGRALCGHTDAEFAGIQTPTEVSPHVHGRPGAVRRESTAPDNLASAVSEAGFQSFHSTGVSHD